MTKTIAQISFLFLFFIYKSQVSERFESKECASILWHIKRRDLMSATFAAFRYKAVCDKALDARPIFDGSKHVTER